MKIHGPKRPVLLLLFDMLREAQYLRQVIDVAMSLYQIGITVGYSTSVHHKPNTTSLKWIDIIIFTINFVHA